MSRVGKKPIQIPEKVTVTISGNLVTVKGPKGELRNEFPGSVTVAQEDGQITVVRSSDDKNIRALHGLTRALINNMIIGVTKGFSKTLDLVGVGYKVEQKEKNILLSLGYSHPIYFMPPDNVEIKVNTPTQMVISGIEKYSVGQIAAKIRSFKLPEPYKGKGIKYSDEVIRRKAGKTAGK